MDSEVAQHNEKMKKLSEELCFIKEDRLRGNKGYSVEEVATSMRIVIQESIENKNPSN